MEYKEEKEIAAEVDDLELDESGSTLEQRFDNLAQYIIMSAWETIKRVRKKGTKIDQEEEYRQGETLKQFKIISGIYEKLKKNGRIAGKPNEHFDEQLLQKIKDKKGSIGDIVRDIPST